MPMKNNIIALMAAAMLAGCQININPDTTDFPPAETRTYPLSGIYKSLEVSSAFNVVMSDTATVATVTVNEGLHNKVIFTIENRTLKIGLKPGLRTVANELSVILPYNENLRKVELSGASRFTSNHPMGQDLANLELSGASEYIGDLDASKIEIELSGASEYTGSVNAGDIDLEFSGASQASISGTCSNELEIDLGGASQLIAKDLDAHYVKGELSGASSADVLCCESIRVEVTGASRLKYNTIADGCDPIVDCHTSGGSTIMRR